MPEIDDEHIRALEKKIDALQDERRDTAEQLGRLRTIAERADEVAQERDALRKENDQLRGELAELRAGLDRRVADEVEAAVASVKEDHERSAKEWEAERERLRKQIETLEAAAPERDSFETKELAAQFRSLLESFSEPETEGTAAGAVLTGLEIEARAILAPGEGDAPRLVMTDPSVVTSPEALSTVRLQFGLVPRLPTEEPQ